MPGGGGGQHPVEHGEALGPGRGAGQPVGETVGGPTQEGVQPHHEPGQLPGRQSQEGAGAEGREVEADPELVPVVGDGRRPGVEAGHEGPEGGGRVARVGHDRDVDGVAQADDEGQVAAGQSPVDPRREPLQPVPGVALHVGPQPRGGPPQRDVDHLLRHPARVRGGPPDSRGTLGRRGVRSWKTKGAALRGGAGHGAVNAKRRITAGETNILPRPRNTHGPSPQTPRHPWALAPDPSPPEGH